MVTDTAAHFEPPFLNQLQQQVIQRRDLEHPILGDMEAVVFDLLLEVGELLLFLLGAEHIPLIDDPEGTLQHALALAVDFRQQLDLFAFQQMEDLHGNHKSLGIVFHIGLGDLAVARIDHAQSRQIHQHYIVGNADVGQVDFGLVDEEDIGVVLGHITGQFIQGYFLGRPAELVPAFDQGLELLVELLLVERTILGPLTFDIAAEPGQHLRLAKGAVGLRIGAQLLREFLQVKILQLSPLGLGQIGDNRLVGLALAYQGRNCGQRLGRLGQDVIPQYRIDDGALAGRKGPQEGDGKFGGLETFQPSPLAVDEILEVFGDIQIGGRPIEDFEKTGERLDVTVVVRLFHRLFPVGSPNFSAPWRVPDSNVCPIPAKLAPVYHRSPVNRLEQVVGPLCRKPLITVNMTDGLHPNFFNQK